MKETLIALCIATLMAAGAFALWHYKQASEDAAKKQAGPDGRVAYKPFQRF